MKNENGFGSIVCLDKTGKKRRKPWGVRITTGWKDDKQVRKYLGYYKTQTEALMALAEYHKNGINLDVSKLTMIEVFDKWVEKQSKKELSSSALRSYNMVRNKLDLLGDKPIKDIRTPHLQTWVDALDLKPRSKKNIRGILSQMYKYAIINDMITKNYAEGVEINEKIESVGSIFSEDEIKTLWEHKNDETVQQVLILIYTGLRINELLKIKVEHINFEEGYAIGGSKTKAGKERVIPFHKDILPIVKDMVSDDIYLSPSINKNKPMSYTKMQYQFQKLMDKFGMTHKIHDTRKTSVSIMHSAGIPMEIIRTIVGHSGQGVTEQVYLRKTPKELVEAINLIKI